MAAEYTPTATVTATARRDCTSQAVEARHAQPLKRAARRQRTWAQPQADIRLVFTLRMSEQQGNDGRYATGPGRFACGHQTIARAAAIVVAISPLRSVLEVEQAREVPNRRAVGGCVGVELGRDGIGKIVTAAPRYRREAPVVFDELQ